MKNLLPLLFLSLITIFTCVESLHAQERIADKEHQHTSLQKIERDYRDGSLTIDQKIRYQFYATKNPQKLPAKYQTTDTKPIKCGK